MWLLSTSRAELHEFPSPEAVPGGYAILSHVWDEKEQTFQVTQWLRQICDKTGANPRDSSHPKIRNACALAESHGYKWLWVDTSCIDKSSSADLSEAINSMYRYYSIASICYAYLHDVPPRDTHRISQPHCARETRATFMQSKWHTRGWTLQELIAPTFVLFLADNWTNLGTKAELADVLQTITYIPASLLRLDTRLADYSVAQRMSWAASRKTTRPEDRAYSLLGIFGINMSTLYGEGEQAFYRLQEEIMKRRADTTLFAWGSKYSPFESLLHPGLITEHKYLLASSPDYFRNCGNVLFTPPGITARNTLQSTKGLANNEHSGTITFSITPYGVLAHIPLIEHWYEDSAGDEVTAYLFWSDHLGNPIGLRLKPCPMSADPFRPHYDVVQERLAHGLSRDGQGRLLDSQRGSVPQPVRLTWQEVYITCRPPPESIVPEHAGKVFVPMNLGSFVPFRILDKDIDALPTSPVPIELTACGALELPWDGDPPVILQFQSRISFRFYAMLHLGQCHKSLPVRVVQTHWWPQDPNPDLGHWAFIQITTKRMEASVAVQRGGRELAHNCHLDHINRWPNKTKSFPIITGPEMDGATVDDAASIILQFDTCPLNPKTTLIMRITTSRRSPTRPPSPLLLDLTHPAPVARVPVSGRTQETVAAVPTTVPQALRRPSTPIMGRAHWQETPSPVVAVPTTVPQALRRPSTIIMAAKRTQYRRPVTPPVPVGRIYTSRSMPEGSAQANTTQLQVVNSSSVVPLHSTGISHDHPPDPMNHGPPASGFDPEPEEDIDLEEGIEGYATADSEDSSMEEDCYDTADESTEEDYDTASDDSNPEDYDTADDFIEEEDDDTEDDPFQDCDEHGRDWRGDGDGGGYFRRESATTTVADLRGANEGDPKVYEEDEAPAVGKQLPPMNEETGGGGCASELRATTWEEWAYPSPSSMRNEEAADKDDKVSKTEGMGGIAEGITEADQQIDIKGEAPATPPPSGTRQSAVRTENLLPVLQGLPELRSGGRWY